MATSHNPVWHNTLTPKNIQFRAIKQRRKSSNSKMQKPEDVWYFSDKYQHWHIDTKADLFYDEWLNRPIFLALIWQKIVGHFCNFITVFELTELWSVWPQRITIKMNILLGVVRFFTMWEQRHRETRVRICELWDNDQDNVTRDIISENSAHLTAAHLILPLPLM